jgi:hypothetical protein
MSSVQARARTIAATAAGDLASMVIVTGCALALVFAGPVVPF